MTEARDSTWFQAIGIHLAIALTLWLTTRVPMDWVQNLKIPNEPIPFEVIENPTAPPQAMQAIPQAKPKVETQARQVFGLQKNALTQDESPDSKTPGVEVKAGNTLAKAPDNLTLRPEDERSLPIPTEEYLVSQMPVLVSDFKVPFPKGPKQRGVQGAVIFDLLIDTQGQVRQTQVVSSPDPELTQAASEALPKLKFKPAMRDGQPVAVRIRYRYNFEIER